jgi:hypothetical protein
MCNLREFLQQENQHDPKPGEECVLGNSGKSFDVSGRLLSRVGHKAGKPGGCGLGNYVFDRLGQMG